MKGSIKEIRGRLHEEVTTYGIKKNKHFPVDKEGPGIPSKEISMHKAMEFLGTGIFSMIWVQSEAGEARERHGRITTPHPS